MSTLSPIDRYHSEPLDVHRWSDHPEIKDLTDTLYDELGLVDLESKSNNKKGAHPRVMLRVLLLDLYVRWLKDPNLATGFQKSVAAYKPNSRYSKLHIGRKIIKVEQALEDHGYLDVLTYYHSNSGAGRSFTTRIRPSQKLQEHYAKLTVSLFDIDLNYLWECIILREKFIDENDKISTTYDIEYDDTELTNRLRSQVEAYNRLLRRTFIDIPSFRTSSFTRRITKGPRTGQTSTISIGPDNKYVRRVFSGGVQSDWKLNGRFYGGWWQQIDKYYRSQIYINDEPTYEYDLKALHPTLLSNRAGVELPEDPYALKDHIITHVDRKTQRSYMKLLVLMAINAKSPKMAYAAFRDSMRGDPVAVSLTDTVLEELLTAFFLEHPHMEKYLCKGLGLELMGIDGQIANMVIDHFTQQSVPVLCIHDSFIINYRLGDELQHVVREATYQLTGYRIKQDIKNKRHTANLQVTGNIAGYQEPVSVDLNTPIRIHPTQEYQTRRDKFYKWVSLSEF